VKSGLKDMIGRTVSAVVIAERPHSPKVLLFLAFTDGTFYEIYGDDIHATSGVCNGGAQDAATYANLFSPEKLDTYTSRS